MKRTSLKRKAPLKPRSHKLPLKRSQRRSVASQGTSKPKARTKRQKKMEMKRKLCEQYELPNLPCSRWGTAKAPTRTDLLRGMLWTVFSKYIRQRDLGKPCITCNKTLHLGDIQAGHYAPVGNSPLSLWFNETNVNGECPRCNADFHGWHLVPMRKNLVKRYSETAIEEIDAIQQVKRAVKWEEHEYVERIKKYLDLLDETP